MGRAKLKLELIRKEKSRNTTFQKRKKGLMNKAYEFSTLCGVDTCLIIYGPKEAGCSVVSPETWPLNSDEVKRIINRYKGKCVGESGKRAHGLNSLFEWRKKKVEDEVAKLQKKILEAKYGVCVESFHGLSVDQLKLFVGRLEEKIETVKRKIFAIQSEEAAMLMAINGFNNQKTLGFNNGGSSSGNNNPFCQLNNQVYFDPTSFGIRQPYGHFPMIDGGDLSWIQGSTANPFMAIQQPFSNYHPLMANGMSQFQGSRGNNLFENDEFEMNSKKGFASGFDF